MNNRDQPTERHEHRRFRNQNQLCISTITLMELICGAEKGYPIVKSDCH